MKKAIFSDSHVMDLPALSEVNISYEKQTSFSFEIVSHAGKIGKALVCEKMVAEICAAGSDYFAVFSTDLGKVTYIFCEDGRGYKLGPGTSQKNFNWG